MSADLLLHTNVQLDPQATFASGLWHRHLRQFWDDTEGFTAAETALLALVLCGLCAFVGNIIYPAVKQAALALNKELAGQLAR